MWAGLHIREALSLSVLNLLRRKVTRETFVRVLESAWV